MPALAFCENVVQQYWELLDIFFNLQKNGIGNNATFKMYWVKLMCCTYIGYSVCVSIFLPIKQHEACLNWKDSKKSQCKLIQSNKTNKLNQDWDSSDVKKLCIYNGSDCLFCCRLFFGDVRALMFICNMQIFVQVYSNVWWNCEIVNKWLMKVYTHMYWIVGKN